MRADVERRESGAPLRTPTEDDAARFASRIDVMIENDKRKTRRRRAARGRAPRAQRRRAPRTRAHGRAATGCASSSSRRRSRKRGKHAPARTPPAADNALVERPPVADLTRPDGRRRTRRWRAAMRPPSSQLAQEENPHPAPCSTTCTRSSTRSRPTRASGASSARRSSTAREKETIVAQAFERARPDRAPHDAAACSQACESRSPRRSSRSSTPLEPRGARRPRCCRVVSARPLEKGELDAIVAPPGRRVPHELRRHGVGRSRT